jgi:hypothetical protein
MTRITAHGLSLAPPAGWDAIIYRRRPALPGEETLPVVHSATVPLPPERGDYGSGVVEMLGPDDVFVSLLEFGAGAAGSPLFRAAGVPGLTPDMFAPKQVQRVLRGQAGVQRFFTHRGRAFCLYAVIGSFPNRVPLCFRVNQVISSLLIEGAP